MLDAAMGAFVAQAVSEAAADPTVEDGLDITEDAINRVIKAVEEQQRRLSPETFRRDGHLAPVAFGGGDQAPRLGSDYTRAYRVIGDTLDGVRKDLENFQEACLQAKRLIARAEDDSEGRLRTTTVSLDDLAAGQRYDHGHHAYQHGQQHQNDEGGNA